jgi:5-oxoprolinase (ATP-hydrolysing) subunit A
MRSIDLNSDVGEPLGRWTLGDDTAMFRFVSSAKIACGFHARDLKAGRFPADLSK